MTRPLIVIVGLLLVVPGWVSAYDALLLDPDEDRIVGEPVVAIADDGATVVAWASHVAEGAQPLNGIRIRRFNSSGAAVGEMFRIDVLPGDLARKPSVDMTPDGSRFVVAWEGGTEGERNKRRIWARVFDSTGRPLEPEFRVDQIRMTHEQWGLPRDYYRDPKVSMAPNGDFVVVWRSEGRTSCDRFNISARRFSRDGVPLGAEFVVNTERSGSQLNPDVDHDASGGFVVVWQSGRWIGTNAEWSQVLARSFGPLGKARSAEIPLNSDRGGAAALPSLVVAPNGAFACAWKEGSGDAGLVRIGARAFDAGGAPLGTPITIEPKPPARGGPHVAIVGDLDLMVAWNGVATDRTESPAVVAQIFNAEGLATSDLFALSPETCWSVSSPSLASSGGYGAVTWESQLEDGLMLRRFSGNAPWRDVPLMSGGRRLADMVAENRRILVGPGAESSDREAAANVLFCLRGSARTALADLRNCASASTTSVQEACCFGVASVAEFPEDALPTLLGVLNDEKKSTAVRSAAACAMGLFGPDGSAAIPALESVLGEDSGHLVGCAGRSLGMIGASNAVPAIAVALLGRSPDPSPLEVHQMLFSGLVEFPEDPRVKKTFTRYWRACNWRHAYLEPPGRPKLDWRDSLERYVKYFLRERKVDDTRLINYNVDEAHRRLEEGWVDTDGYRYGGRGPRDHDEIDIMVTRFVAIRNLGEVSLCDGVVTLASAIAQFDEVPEWASELFDRFFWEYKSTPCPADLLAVAEGMGAKGAPLAETIVRRLGPNDSPWIDALRALAATDPGCKTCVPALRRLLSVEDLEVKIEVIHTLLAGGPPVIRECKDELTVMLRDTSPELRLYSEMALDLIEIEADTCKTSWLPVDNPNLEPPSPPRSAAPSGIGWVPTGRSAMPPHPVRTLPVGSAMPPDAVRTPVPGSGYTGRPKKPD